MICIGYQSSRESFSRSRCSDTRPSMASRLLNWSNCLFAWQVIRHWTETDLNPVRISSFHPQQGKLPTVNVVLQWRILPGGITSLWKSATPVPCKRFVSDSRRFYIERLTTSVRHNLTVCLFMNSGRFVEIYYFLYCQWPNVCNVPWDVSMDFGAI